MNIELITGSLAVSDAPGLATVDPRFTDIATLVQDGKYDEAGRLSQEVLAEEVYDIRVIGYFAYGHFLETGVGGLKELVPALAQLLTDNFEALGPVRNREKHTQTAFNWLMKQLSKKLSYEQDKKGDLWERWLAEVSSEDVQDILTATDALRRALSMVLEEKAGQVLDGLSKVNEWLNHFQMLVYKEPEPELEPEPDVEEVADEEAEASRSESASAGSFSSYGASMEVNGSPALTVLMEKMAAFDVLITQGKTSRAALVADDINAIIEDFDPRVYFPQLFANFTLKYVTHINALSAFKGHKESLEWKAMQELYKVDLASFVDFDADGIAFTLGSQEGGDASSEGFGYDAPDESGFGEPDAGEESMNGGGW